MIALIKKRPLLIAAIYLLAGLALHNLTPGPEIIGSSWRYLGAVLIAAGLWVFLWAGLAFVRKGTTFCPEETPSALVTTGPMRISRNPMYLGIVLILLGNALLIGSIPAFLPAPAFFLTAQAFFIRQEEETLERIFGEVYLAYCRRVKRWL